MTDNALMELLVKYGWVLVLIIIVALHKMVLRIFFGTVIVSKDEIGIVNKKWVLFGKYRELPGGAIIALNGEAGSTGRHARPGNPFWTLGVAIRGDPGPFCDHR